MSFPFTFVGWAFVTMRLWRHDLLGRCPACLRRLGLSDVRGNASDLLIAPLERETICLHGHGANIESRWGHAFETDRFTDIVTMTATSLHIHPRYPLFSDCLNKSGQATGVGRLPR